MVWSSVRVVKIKMISFYLHRVQQTTAINIWRNSWRESYFVWPSELGISVMEKIKVILSIWSDNFDPLHQTNKEMPKSLPFIAAFMSFDQIIYGLSSIASPLGHYSQSNTFCVQVFHSLVFKLQLNMWPPLFLHIKSGAIYWEKSAFFQSFGGKKSPEISQGPQAF